MQKRPQLRRCRNCQKVGHNTSTCSVFVTPQIPTTPLNTKPIQKPAKISKTTTPPPAPAEPTTGAEKMPLKFYVHHVNFEPRHSPHVVNLKDQQKSVWDQVAAIAPTDAVEESLYHFHHQKTQSSPLSEIRSTSEHLSNNAQPAPLFVDFKNPEMVSKKSDTPLNKAEKKIFALPATDQTWWSKFKASKTQLTKPPVKLEVVEQPVVTTPAKPSLSLKQLTQNYFSFFAFKKKKSLANTPPPLTTTTPTQPRLTQKNQSFFAPLFNNMLMRKRLAFALALLLIISIIPKQAQGYYSNLKQTKQTVTNQSTEGFMALQESTSALLSSNIPSAEQSTINALQNFNAALKTLENNHQLLQKIISVVPILKDEVQSRQELLNAGYKISLGNTYLLKGLETTEQQAGEKPTQRLQTLVDHLQAALPNYDDALTSLNKVKTNSLPPEFQAPFKDFKTVFTAAVGDFKELSSLGQSFQEIFGGQGMRRYLVMFQNPDELRATGGFTGSFAVVDIKDGELIKIDVPPGGTYDVQGQLDKYIDPPTPFLLFSKGYWQFHDANWFPDFPTSAENTIWFYRHTGRGSVDGVIAINSTFLTRLLGIIGPIQNEKNGVTLTSENALTTLRNSIDAANASPATTLKPKQILSDLTPSFINYFKNLKPTDLLPLLVTTKEALSQKEVQIYFTDKTIQEKIVSFGWGGTLTPSLPEQDYLNVNISNFNGGKTDARIEQHLTHQTVVAEDGSVIDTLVITRKHTGTTQDELYNRPNVAYFRVYVPEGSTLLSVNGVIQPDETAFHSPVTWAEKGELLNRVEKEIGIDQKSGTRITQEFQKTVFGNWVVTKPGETSQVQISYKLPFKIFNPVTPPTSGLQNLINPNPSIVAKYQLILQRQSGIKNKFESQIIFPVSWEPLWNEGNSLDLAANGASIAPVDVEHDSIWSLAMRKKN